MIRNLSQRLRTVVLRTGGGFQGARSVKTTTGIVGLPYDPKARETLTANLIKIKELMTELVPETAYYRQKTVKDVDDKLQLLKEYENDEALEEVLGFQLEQVISMTEDEIKLIPFMAEQKPWDVPSDYEYKVYEGYDPHETGMWEGPPGAMGSETPQKDS